MKSLLLLIGCYILFWITEYIICMIWCFVRKKKDNKVNNVSNGEGASEKKRGKLANNVILFLDGLVFVMLKKTGYFPSNAFRVFILRHVFGMNIAKNVLIYSGFEIRSPWKISIGKNSIIGNESKLDGRKGLQIGENVNLSTGVWIWTQQHDYNDRQFELDKKKGTVVIGDRVWLGGRVIVLPGVEIKEGAVVASGAVVTKTLEGYALYGGVPAKYISTRAKDIEYDFDGMHMWFV